MSNSTTTKPAKPLGMRAYGHIGHLIGSRMGPGDHRLHDGQCRILTEKVRDAHDRIIVQEKLDGSCVAVSRVGGNLIPLIRAGYPAVSSPYRQHTMFHDWAWANLGHFEFLREGERLVGEWLAQAHGTRYHLGDRQPFAAFDLMTGHRRATLAEFLRCLPQWFDTPTLLHEGGPLSIDAAMERNGPHGAYGALDPVEGCVWRCERAGEVDFLGKFVRPDKVDGRYLPEVSGQEAVWNWRPAP